MSLRRKQQLVNATVGWMLCTVCALVLLDALSVESFFVVSFAGFLVLVELATPVAVTPRWKRKLKWVVVGGTLVFGYIVARRILRPLVGRVL